MPDFIVTTTPWGLVSQRPEERIEIAGPGSTRQLPSGGHPMLFCDSTSRPYLDNSLDALDLQAELRTRHGDRQAFYALPVPLRAEQGQTLRKQSWREAAAINWDGLLSRPTQKDQDVLNDDPDRQHFQFLMGIVGRMQDFDAALSDAESFLPWEAVLDKWLESETNQNPTMDILVRHAASCRARWADIAEKPRRLLNRTRELVALGRVEELDIHCMAWLSRQPGRTNPERAGPRQRILALARYENLNTLENRVFRDLLERTDFAAHDYLRQNAGRRIREGILGRTSRYTMVETYARECRRLARELASLGISLPDGLVQPNFVLMQDDRYRHVWTAWQEIVKRERVFDDLWRWQRRAWAEFAKAACGVALRAADGGELEAASPLFFRMEHRRGEWLMHDDPLVILAFRQLGFVIEVLDGRSGDLARALPELGASSWLRFSDLEGGAHRYLAVWTTLGMGQKPSLHDLVASADEAIARLRSIHPAANLMGGLVLQAETSPSMEVTLQSSETVTGISFGPFDKQLAPGLEILGDEIVELVRANL